MHSRGIKKLNKLFLYKQNKHGLKLVYDGLEHRFDVIAAFSDEIMKIVVDVM